MKGAKWEGGGCSMVAKMGQRCSVAVAAVRMGPQGVITCNCSSLPSLSLCVQLGNHWQKLKVGQRD